MLATDNPIEYEGTYPLPEAQLDRFLLRVQIGYLAPADETAMLQRRLDRGSGPPGGASWWRLRSCSPCANRSSRSRSTDVLLYIVALVAATRYHPKLTVGASPRGGLALVQLARGKAMLAGRDYVTPEDVKAVAVPALGHR